MQKLTLRCLEYEYDDRPSAAEVHDELRESEDEEEDDDEDEEDEAEDK